MSTQISAPRAIVRSAGAVGRALALAAASVGTALATHVAPVAINDGNPTCADLDGEFGGGQTWGEVRLQDDDLADGTYAVGPGSITISNYTESSSGTPGSFDWTSTFGVDAVFVKAGNDKHNLYVYAPTAASPEAFGDTGVGPQAGQGNGISHINFCYDGTDPTPTPTATATPATPTPTVTGSVEQATGTPAPTLPPTDAFDGSTGTGGGGWAVAMFALGGLVVLALVLTPVRRRRR
jgi:hypothetical protein